MNITELKELAEKATPGPWKNVDGIVLVHWDTHPYATWLANFAVGGESMEKKLANSAFCAAANPAEILELIAKLEDAQGEIRALRATEAGLQYRLAQVEAEHAALLKAISDAIPVFWYRPVMNGDMYEGPHHNNCFAGRLQRAEKPGEWLPLYTLNGIKKP